MRWPLEHPLPPLLLPTCVVWRVFRPLLSSATVHNLCTLFEFCVHGCTFPSLTSAGRARSWAVAGLRDHERQHNPNLRGVLQRWLLLEVMWRKDRKRTPATALCGGSIDNRSSHTRAKVKLRSMAS